MRNVPVFATAFLLSLSVASHAQTPNAAAPPVTPAVETLVGGLGRLAGTSVDDKPTAYTRIFLTGHLIGPGIPLPPPPPVPMPYPPPPVDLTQPTLTGQCTRDADGALNFQLYVNFGNVPDPAYYPPWHATKQLNVKPPTGKTKLTMEFLGIVKQKPIKRQFEVMRQPVGTYRYTTPGFHSSNLEPADVILYAMRTGPTLHISTGEHTAEFDTVAFLEQLHKEPMCAGGRL